MPGRRPDPGAGSGDSDASERAGEVPNEEIISRTKAYLANRPSGPFETHPYF